MPPHHLLTLSFSYHCITFCRIMQYHLPFIYTKLQKHLYSLVGFNLYCLFCVKIALSSMKFALIYSNDNLQKNKAKHLMLRFIVYLIFIFLSSIFCKYGAACKHLFNFGNILTLILLSCCRRCLDGRRRDNFRRFLNHSFFGGR